MRGRKPTPTVLKWMRGNPGRRPLNADEPKPEALGPDMPTELADDPIASRTWTRTIVPAIARGQITAADREMAISYCELWSDYRSQRADGARHANIIAVGKHGYPTPNPAKMMARKTHEAFKGVAAELGLTPSSRTRVKATPVGSRQSALEKFRKTGTS